MLRMANDLMGYLIRATDGEIGGVQDFLFDDREWTVRYIVVDTGTWLPGRRVLIAPEAFGEPRWFEREIPVGLTKQQVKDSPDVDTRRPVSRQHEAEVRRYYGWQPYWAVPAGGFITGAATPVMPPPTEPTERSETAGDAAPIAEERPHLRSMREVTGYGIAANDGDIGHIEDFVLDAERWRVVHAVVDTRRWLPGKHVVLALDWIADIDWQDKKVHVDLPRSRIEGAPEFDGTQPVNEEYARVLYDYYGRPVRRAS